MTARSYASPADFKKAVEQRLKSATASGTELGRRRQVLVYERFLARVTFAFGDAATLKGGLVLELRVEQARATKDIDLSVTGSPQTVLARLQDAALRDLGDFMTFAVAVDARHPAIVNDGMPYPGQRFRAECRLAGKVYGSPFGIDVAFGDPVLGASEVLTASNTLDFAGILPATIRVYPIETHLAEKVHAYTMPRQRLNSRVKDLPDMALLATIRAIDATRLRAAVAKTYAYRRTHTPPRALPAPPDAWAAPYAEMARQNRLPWTDLAEVTDAARAFLDPVLGGTTEATWDPASWHWIPR